ncbi:MAG: hypothetical protein OEY86_20410 [Nitrospira sp.]|nr:hypothetical protein [Nitrospira sp.]
MKTNNNLLIFFLLAVAVAFLLFGGELPPPVPCEDCPTETVSPTEVETEEPAEPTVTATATPSPTPTRIIMTVDAPTIDPNSTPTAIAGEDVSDDSPNLLVNPSFEGPVRIVLFNEVQVKIGWEPFYCDEPYTPEKCLTVQRNETGEEFTLPMARPEFKDTQVENRVHSGQAAQQWFCFYKVCRAGVYQTIETTPGANCEAGAYVQSWSTPDWNLTGDRSLMAEDDDLINSIWMIRVDLDGDTFAFSESNLDSGDLLISRGFTHEIDGHYDKYVLISYEFTANSYETTVFFENVRLFPFAHNDSYIDDAYVRCDQ